MSSVSKATSPCTPNPRYTNKSATQVGVQRRAPPRNNYVYNTVLYAIRGKCL